MCGKLRGVTLAGITFAVMLSCASAAGLGRPKRRASKGVLHKEYPGVPAGDRCATDIETGRAKMHSATATKLRSFAERFQLLKSRSARVIASSRAWEWYHSFLAQHVDWLEEEHLLEYLSNVIEMLQTTAEAEFSAFLQVNEDALRWMLESHIPPRAYRLLFPPEEDDVIPGMGAASLVGLALHGAEVINSSHVHFYTKLANDYSLPGFIRPSTLREFINRQVSHRDYDKLFDLAADASLFPVIIRYFPHIPQFLTDVPGWIWQALGDDWRKRGIPSTFRGDDQDWFLSHIPMWTRCYVGCEKDTWRNWEVNDIAGAYMQEQLQLHAPDTWGFNGMDSLVDVLGEYIQMLKLLGHPPVAWEAHQKSLLTSQLADGSWAGECKPQNCGCYTVSHYVYPVVLGIVQGHQTEPKIPDFSSLVRRRQSGADRRIAYLTKNEFARMYDNGAEMWDVAQKPNIPFKLGETVRVKSRINPDTAPRYWAPLSVGVKGRVIGIGKDGSVELRSGAAKYTQHVLPADVAKLERFGEGSKLHMQERRVAYLTRDEFLLLPKKGQQAWDRASTISIHAVCRRGDVVRVKSDFEPDTDREDRERLLKGMTGYVEDVFDDERSVEIFIHKHALTQTVLVRNFDKIEFMPDARHAKRSEL